MKHPNHMSDEELREYSDRHLAYEVDMLRWSGSILYAYVPPPVGIPPAENPLKKPTSNAFLESFAIHARNLIDFLYLRNHYRNDRPTDVLLEDYLGGELPPQSLPAITPLLQNAKKMADKQVAHLASNRLLYGVMDRAWAFTLIYADITTALRAVLPLLPDQRVAPSLRDILSPAIAPFLSIQADAFHDEAGEAIGIMLYKKPPLFAAA